MQIQNTDRNCNVTLLHDITHISDSKKILNILCGVCQIGPRQIYNVPKLHIGIDEFLLILLSAFSLHFTKS